MLDMAKVAAAISQSQDQLWGTEDGAYQLLIDTWDALLKDPLFAYRVAATSGAPWPLPSWRDPLSLVTSITPYREPYTIISSDGSQVYPDRHEGVSCGLINIGTVVIPYRNEGHGVVLTNEPILVLPESYTDGLSPHDFVSIQRQGHELKHAVVTALSLGAQPDEANVRRETDWRRQVIFDGSYIFWHLQSIFGFEAIIHDYCSTLATLEAQKIPYGFYISAPNSKDVLNLVRLQLCNFNPAHESAYAPIRSFTDATLMNHQLTVGQRSIFFKSSAPVTLLYPPLQQPYFCYLRTSTEIGRLEVPAWLVHDAALCEQFLACVADQCAKGNGYPIALAEAHEQAVVKGPDRELFFTLLAQSGARVGNVSAKQGHKNRPSI
jgi:hypothetical protein